jgi:phytoene synthase
VVAGRSPDLEAAYGACARLAREHYENFPVASWLLPAKTRPHVAAVYAFARVADDFADEGHAPASERLGRLEDWRTRLHECAEGSSVARGDGHDAVFLALGHTLRSYALPVSLCDDLLSAFAQDVTTTRYETWAELLDYCRRSANPVGRLVLRIAGFADETLARQSDAVCTALQLTNFWQDFAIDWRRGRLYLPLEEAAKWNARPDTLDPERLSPEWQRALEAAAARTRALFETGRPVCDGVAGRLRYELRVTWLGGMAILDRLAATGYDPARHRPALGARDAWRLLYRAVRWTSRSRHGGTA